MWYRRRCCERGYAGARLREYTDAILRQEWEDMQRGRECGRAQIQLEQLWLSLG